MSNKSFPKIAVSLMLLIFFAFGIGLFVSNHNQKLKKTIKDLSLSIHYLKSETRFADLKILSSDEKQIQFKLSFFSQEQKRVYHKKLSLMGNDLYLESIVLVIREKEEFRALIFPIRLYSDQVPPVHGISLDSLYPKGKLPLLYSFVKQKNLQKQIQFLYKIAMNPVENHRINRFKTSIHLGPFNHLKEEQNYSFVLYPNGSVEVKEKD